MDLLNFQNLALGGVAAAVIGFWGQVKNMLRYVSSAVVVQATLDSTLSYNVGYYAKTQWKQAPSGIQVFRSIYLLLKDGSWRHVPYKSLPNDILFYRGKQFFYLKFDQNGDAKVWHIRGFASVEYLITQALLLNDVNAVQQTVDRFCVIQLIGREKGMWAATSGRNTDSDSASETSAAAPKSIGTSLPNVFTPNHVTDTSFMYSKDLIQFNTESDPLKGLFYDDDTLKHLNDAMLWLESEKWYAERSIPWKRGWLIHGPGGTGKSSLALVTAKKMRVPLYQFALSTMSDQEFIYKWQNMTVPCVALFEDFDTVFNKRESLTEHRSLTFDCILNQISGVKNLSGVFLIVTTNHIDKIDEALGVVSDAGTISTRPGRIDHVIYLGPASVQQKTKMVQHILKDWPDAHTDLISQSIGYTAVQFQELCIQYAFNKLDEQKKQKDYPVLKDRVYSYTVVTQEHDLVMDTCLVKETT